MCSVSFINFTAGKLSDATRMVQVKFHFQMVAYAIAIHLVEMNGDFWTEP